MRATEGYVNVADDVRLFFRKIGDGRSTIVIPNAVYLFDDFKHLAAAHTCIFYDLRNRGRSTEVTDEALLKGGVHNDVQDLEAVRRHFELEEVSVLGHSYLGAVVGLHAMQYPGNVARVVQIGPTAPSITKQYPPDLTNMDATATQVFAQLAQVQNESGSADPVEMCNRVWSILRPLYVADRADVHKISRMGGGLDWARSLPDARLLTVDGAAHLPWIEAPELVFGSIETFLGGSWPASAEKVA